MGLPQKKYQSVENDYKFLKTKLYLNLNKKEEKMSNNDITWDALLVSKTKVDSKIQTVWEKKNFKAPDAKDTALTVAKSLFETAGDSTSEAVSVVVKNVIRVGQTYE